ncbi:MAG: phosphonoacetaldehyde hydrolase [Candidatus Hydrogenedentes bacterium]|nr:phosphonoacetaldehyde hydrolase [Candidatus Hydrogenedentota bacterium]
MSSESRRGYRGPLKAAIFDWAGTTVDYGCCAPAAVFLDVFEKRGIAVTQEQAREPMGMHKRDHIRVMCRMQPIAEQWSARYGRQPSEEDVESMFQEFVPLQLAVIEKHADIIPGTIETMAALRTRGMGIGSTTGYNDAMMRLLVPKAAEGGYAPDVVVCVSDVPEGRPAPWMALEAAKQLGVYPVEAIVKVGDTVADIGEGLNAGMWTVAVVEHGNEVGLPEADLVRLTSAERKDRLSRARQRLLDAGAHYAVETIADLPEVLDRIDERLRQGEKP